MDTKEMHDFAEQVAEFLIRWEYRESQDKGHWPSLHSLDHKDGKIILGGVGWLRSASRGALGTFPRDNNRVMNPKYCGGKQERHEIGFSPKKTPEQAAKDLDRRLISGYLADLKLVEARIAENEKAREKALDRIIEIAGHLRHGNVDPPGDPDNPSFRAYTSEDIYVDVKTTTGETFDIDLSNVPFEAAKRIAKAIKGGG